MAAKHYGTHALSSHDQVEAELSQDVCYQRLNILDAKCTSLLQLCAVLAAIQSIPTAATEAPIWVRAIGASSVLVFLLVSFLALGVLAVEWEPSCVEVERRTKAYMRCRNWARVGLLLGAAFVVSALISSTLNP